MIPHHSLGHGDSFRLLFVTGTTRNAQSSNIADYNSFVQGRANVGHTAIRGFSGEFRALISTATVDARDNTATTHTTANPGVPIYWLGGSKAADNYADFYDGTWDTNQGREPDGETNASGFVYVWTGSSSNGTGRANFQAGSTNVQVGRTKSIANHVGINDGNATSSDSRRLYGLSPVITVSHAPGQVTGVQVDQVTHDSIRVRWTKPSESSSRPITSFGIHTRTRNEAGTGWIVDSGPGGTTNAEGWRWRASPGASATSHTLTGLPSDVLQQVRVFARAEQSGQTPPTLYGDSSAAVQFTTLADTTPPTLSTAVVNGATLVLTYNEALDENSAPAASAFTVRVGGVARTVSNVAVSGSAVTLTLSSAVAARETVTVSYAVPTSNPVRDAAGNDAGAFDNQSATNATPGVVFLPAPLTLTEGGSGSYTVALAVQPSGSVTVTITSSNAEVTIDDTDGVTTGVQNTLTFTTGNWGTAQTVTVRAAEDDDEDNDSATLTHGLTGAAEYAGLTDPTLSVTVNDNDGVNHAPEFGATSYAFDLAENADGSTTAIAVGSVSATDANAGDTVSYSITAGDTGNVFAIDSSTGAITYTGGGEDHETTLRFSLTVEADDGQDGSATVTVTVNVTDVNEAPVFDLTGLTVDMSGTVLFSVPENTTAVGTITAADPDAADTHVDYGDSGTDRALFVTSSTGGVITFANAPDFEDPQGGASDDSNEYTFVVNAASGAGDRRMGSTLNVKVTVTDIEAPSAPSAPTFGTSTSSGIVVNWREPVNAGPAITDYDVRYREATTPPSAWSDAGHAGTATTATLTALRAGASYEVQVRATSIEGMSAWSASGTATIRANTAPAFAATSYGFELAENADGSTAAVAVGTVSATDCRCRPDGHVLPPCRRQHGQRVRHRPVQRRHHLHRKGRELRDNPQLHADRAGERRRRQHRRDGDGHRHRRGRAAGCAGRADLRRLDVDQRGGELAGAREHGSGDHGLRRAVPAGHVGRLDGANPRRDGHDDDPHGIDGRQPATRCRCGRPTRKARAAGRPRARPRPPPTARRRSPRRATPSSWPRTPTAARWPWPWARSRRPTPMPARR